MVEPIAYNQSTKYRIIWLLLSLLFRPKLFILSDNVVNFVYNQLYFHMLIKYN